MRPRISIIGSVRPSVRPFVVVVVDCQRVKFANSESSIKAYRGDSSLREASRNAATHDVKLDVQPW